MKSTIHPSYHSDAKIVCACGNQKVVGSTVPETHVELCNVCHPFYSGKKVLIDTEHRAEKFEARAKKQAEVMRLSKREKADKRAKQRAAKQESAKQALLQVEEA